MFGNALAALFMGPSKFLDFPDSYWCIIASFPILGIFEVLVFLPVIPEMIERIQVDLGISEGEDE
jgi:hypothetical protein